MSRVHSDAVGVSVPTELEAGALDELERLASAATQGPWFDSDGVVWFDSREQVCCGRGYHQCCGEPDIIGGQEKLAESNPTDAAFIAAANPATVLALIAATRRALAGYEAEGRMNPTPATIQEER